MGFQQFAHCLEHLELKCAILMSVFEHNCLFCYHWGNKIDRNLHLFLNKLKWRKISIVSVLIINDLIVKFKQQSNLKIEYSCTMCANTCFHTLSLCVNQFICIIMKEKKFNEFLFILENRYQKISSIWRLFGWIFLHELRRKKNAWKETKKKILRWKWMIWR